MRGMRGMKEERKRGEGRGGRGEGRGGAHD